MGYKVTCHMSLSFYCRVLLPVVIWAAIVRHGYACAVMNGGGTIVQ